MTDKLAEAEGFDAIHARLLKQRDMLLPLLNLLELHLDRAMARKDADVADPLAVHINRIEQALEVYALEMAEVFEDSMKARKEHYSRSAEVSPGAGVPDKPDTDRDS